MSDSEGRVSVVTAFDAELTIMRCELSVSVRGSGWSSFVGVAKEISVFTTVEMF